MKTSRKNRSSRSFLAGIITATVLILAVGTLTLLVRCHASLTTKEQVALTPLQMESLQAIGEWEFLSVSDEEIADTVRRGFFSDDELVRIYRGTLRLGFSMADTEPGWISLQADTLRVLLPPIRLLDSDFLDEADATAFYETGTWSQADREKLAQQARRKMTARCLSPSNIASAERNATAQFHQILQSMGFKNIRIRFRDESTKVHASEKAFQDKN